VKEKNPENTFQDSKSNPSQFEWTVKKSHEDDGDDESESLQTHVMVILIKIHTSKEYLFTIIIFFNVEYRA